MEFKLGQKVEYKRVARKKSFYICDKDFKDTEIVTVDKIALATLNKRRVGFIVGTRDIAHIVEYTFWDDDPDDHGYVKHEKTVTIKVYKVAYDMAHTNFVLGKDLEEVKT